MNRKWIMENGKLVIILFFIIFFTGCSNKEINIYTVEKPKEIQNEKIKFIKIDNIQNDKANLKEKIIQKMKEVNNIIPNYFHINPKNYQSVLSGTEKINKKDTFYHKKAKIIYKKPRCMVTLYPCKEVGGMFFCNFSNPIHYSLKDFNLLQKKSYQNGNYILINNQIYKKNISCKPEFATITCEKKEISLKAKLNIKDKNNNLLFSKTYKKLSIDDPCADIKEIYPNDPKKYKAYLNFNQKADELAYLIASEFIEDIAPHNITFNAKLFDDLDVKADFKDKKRFENIINEITKNPQNSKNLIDEMQQLANKYPNSCIIKYDLAVMYMKIKNYQKAKNLLLQLNNCNENIQKERERLINILERIYF
ncbi:conserved hypothetical protein [Lebetimonas natsushimae]|uniref:Tetratricopeptide repeat protein n=1 Tax=Lebetimonas natsushimae TaxID=1936991 RepID=A0A292YFG6_9BACT|nr:hypothetical protein [Lebetimonas natsushimae]GAX87863.1 conserved hypothetical protein [Lebetimonas natsushimae]